MPDENAQVDTASPETLAPETQEAAAQVTQTASQSANPDAPANDPIAEDEEAPRPDVEMVMCMVSKQKVPIDETIEVERKKGEVLRIHSRYKKFD